MSGRGPLLSTAAPYRFKAMNRTMKVKRTNKNATGSVCSSSSQVNSELRRRSLYNRPTLCRVDSRRALYRQPTHLKAKSMCYPPCKPSFSTFLKVIRSERQRQAATSSPRGRRIKLLETSSRKNAYSPTKLRQRIPKRFLSPSSRRPSETLPRRLKS